MVFYISLILIGLFVLWGVFYPEHLSATANATFEFTISTFGWFYLLVTLGFLIFSLYIAFSKYGTIRLGDDDDEPEYSNISWFAMLFSAGMGIGLVFWGVAEPLSHYLVPPEGALGGTAQAARLAMRYSFFHWGLHPWAIYSVISLALAYFKFRKGYRGLISATFTPLLGDRVNGPIGKGIDILAILATVFGVATSLGLGTLQIGGGLNHLFHIPNVVWTQIIIIAAVTVLYLISATAGLDKGIKTISNINLIIAVGLMLFVLMTGPTSFIFDTFTSNARRIFAKCRSDEFKAVAFHRKHMDRHMDLVLLVVVDCMGSLRRNVHCQSIQRQNHTRIYSWGINHSQCIRLCLVFRIWRHWP